MRSQPISWTTNLFPKITKHSNEFYLCVESYITQCHLMWFISKKNSSTIEAALGEFIEKNDLSSYACAI